MKKLVRLSILGLVLIALLPFFSCEAGLTSSDSSKTDGEKFSFSQIYSSINALQEEVKSLKSVIEEQDGEIFALQNRSSIGDIYFNNGNVDIGTVDQDSNLQVYGNARVDGSLTLERKGYISIKNVHSYIPEDGYVSGQEWAPRYYHIRTPDTNQNGSMYRYDLKGYSYGISRALSLTWCGYLYGASPGILNQHNIDTAGAGIPVSQYIGSDNHLYLKFGPISQYCNYFSIDFQGVTGTLANLTSENFTVTRTATNVQL
ncbi:MAG: hypothetical protein GY754_29595 [bacterium]|nr:hypothetical protein [bacterium]